MANDSLNWANAEYLYLGLLLLPLWLLLFVLARRRRWQRLSKLLGSQQDLAEASPSVIRQPSLWVALIALGCIILAMARPRWGYEERDIERRGVDIMLVLDVSRSMDAQDIQPSRLERAKREIIDLLNMLEGDRVGLVVFAGVAFVQCPPTVDYSAVRLFLDHLETGMIPVPGTALGDALQLADQSLQAAATADSAGQAIILLSDGEDHGSDASSRAQSLADRGVRIFAIGMGTQSGAPIPLAEGGFLQDATGAMVVSQLQESSLQAVTQAASGLYVRSDTSDFDLDQIYRQRIQKDMREGTIYAREERLWFERFQWFAGAAWLLLCAEAMIRWRLGRR